MDQRDHQNLHAFGFPRTIPTGPFRSLYIESYKVLPKRNYNGAHVMTIATAKIMTAPTTTLINSNNNRNTNIRYVTPVATII